MRRLLAAVLILHGLTAFALAVQPEVPVSPAELLPVLGHADDFHLATDGEIYVAVWFDRRSSPVTTYAARLRPDGTLLDRVGIRVGEGADAGAVVWTGSAFLISYLEGGVEGGTVKARTLTPDGVLGEVFPLFTTETPASDFRMRMASNGDSVLLLTSDSSAALLDLDGRKLRDLDLGWQFGGNFSVAAAGSTYLVVASRHNGDLKTRIVTADGELGASHILMDVVRGGVDVASDGNRFFVTWARGNLYSQFLTLDGEPVGEPVRLTDVPGVHSGSHFVTRLLRRGDEYLLLYMAQSGPRQTLRLGNDAEKLGPLFTAPPVPVGEVATHDGGGAVLGITAQTGLTAAFFDAGSPSTLRDPTPVTFAGRLQWHVRLARVDGGFAAAWSSMWDAVPEIYLSRGPGSAPVLVTKGAFVLVDVVFESGAIWVFWETTDDDDVGKVYTRRYTPALQAIDAEPVLVTAFTGYPEFGVAAGGGAVVVASSHPEGYYGEPEPVGPHVQAYILRATPGGVTVENIGIASRTGADRLPVVEWDGSAFVIAWANATSPYSGARGIAANDRGTGIFPDDRILARRMNAAGLLLGPVIEVAVTKHVDALQLANGIAVWQTYEVPLLSLKRHTYAARVAEDSAVADLGGEDTFFGSVAADDGGGFLLTRAKPVDEMNMVPELLRVGADLGIADSATLAPIPMNLVYYSSDPYDADVIGGPMRTLGYARVAGAEYGFQQRVVVRRIAETSRRRGVRITQ